MTVVYFFLAALGLGFLIFIHELGHYFAARMVGIKVEAFSIGFGKAIFSWKAKTGVEWRVGWLPFGGYVRMLGTDKKGGRPPHEIPGGFFHARPIDRIKVALAGPIVNLIFSFVAFTLLWGLGGREKPFSEFTHRLGFVDPVSELYRDGVRPGDIVDSYDGELVKSSRDHLHAPLLGGQEIDVKGYFVNYPQESKEPFDLRVHPYPHPYALEEGITTLGVLSPAQYLIYNPSAHTASSLPAGSPMKDSGIQSGDRLFWVDGSLIFSSEQLSQILSSGQALLTVERDGKQMLVRVPRITLDELNLLPSDKEDLEDWYYELGYAGRAKAAHFIPYTLGKDGTVRRAIRALDEDLNENLNRPGRSAIEQSLIPGDRITAVDGKPATSGIEILRLLQDHQVLLIVERKLAGWPRISWRDSDADFDRDVDWNALSALTSSVGQAEPLHRVGNLVLLNPVHPVSVFSLEEAAGRGEEFQALIAKRREEIEKLRDVSRRERLLTELDENEERLRLGLELQDRIVRYNPLPTTMMLNIASETWRTWKALVSGYLNPKWLSGPVGIVQVIQHGWAIGFREALFWLAVISFNLAVLNLLPIPVLDGGQVAFASWEMITRRRLRIETMEKLVIPFVILLIGFFIFVTYQDLSRIFHGLF